MLDPRVRRHGRALLTPTGRFLRLRDGASLEHPSAALARRLVAAGAAHPDPAPLPLTDVTVVVPVRDRAEELARCLASLPDVDVLVVDDGSVDPAAVAEVCARFGAAYTSRPNGGPAAARNTALPLLQTDVVAFVDSDVVVPAGVLERLRGHLADPTVDAAAPRVVGGARSPLDLGTRAGAVGALVGYVPTATLLVRRSALDSFDEALRYGEDVDLVWRLPGTVRYDPSVQVAHTEPARLRDRLVRRYRYGTSAAPLSERHPSRVVHVVLPPWPTAVLALALARRPLLAASTAAVWTAKTHRQLGDLPLSAAAVTSSTRATALGLGRALSLLGPAAWGLAARDRRALALLLLPLLAEWAERRTTDPVRYVGAGLLDQAAYGAGVVAGCVQHRTARPLLPRRGLAEN